MLTVGDIKKLTEVFATKEELKQLEERLVSKELFNGALGKLDLILGKLKSMREENTIHIQKHEDIDAQLEELRGLPMIAHELKKKKSA